MRRYDFAPVDERFVDRQGCGDEMDIDRAMRAALMISELGGLDFTVAADDGHDDACTLARH